MKKSFSKFNPDWVSAPGETVAHIMAEKNITPNQLAKLLKIKIIEVEDLIKGKLVITENLAQNLANTLGSTQKFWLKREFDYQSELKRLNIN